MRRVVMVVCAALLFIPVALKSRSNQETPVRAAFRPMSGGRVFIKVIGEVLHPGIYEVPANPLATSVIKMADPLQPMKHYNSHATTGRPLLNGDAVGLLKQPDGRLLLTIDKMTVPERLVLGIPLDIATMNEADFERLPGIGPSLARRISAHRHKNGGMLRVEDLPAVDGIGEKKYKTIRGYFQHKVTIE